MEVPGTEANVLNTNCLEDGVWPELSTGNFGDGLLFYRVAADEHYEYVIDVSHIMTSIGTGV